MSAGVEERRRIRVRVWRGAEGELGFGAADRSIDWGFVRVCLCVVALALRRSLGFSTVDI
jgi:hypothetical protein